VINSDLRNYLPSWALIPQLGSCTTIMVQLPYQSSSRSPLVVALQPSILYLHNNTTTTILHRPLTTQPAPRMKGRGVGPDAACRGEDQFKRRMKDTMHDVALRGDRIFLLVGHLVSVIDPFFVEETARWILDVLPMDLWRLQTSNRASIEFPNASEKICFSHRYDDDP
jgi:hypothetical protein